jgi:hypothetical protein
VVVVEVEVLAPTVIQGRAGKMLLINTAVMAVMVQMVAVLMMKTAVMVVVVVLELMMAMADTAVMAVMVTTQSPGVGTVDMEVTVELMEEMEEMVVQEDLKWLTLLVVKEETVETDT